MSRRVATIIEVATFAALAILAVLWVWSKNGNYEPWIVLCGVVTGGLELYRRFVLKEEAESSGSPGDTARSLLSWLTANASTRDLSETLPKAVRLAQMLGDKDFETWARLELYGYRSDNGMAETDVVPEYRTVVGQHTNRYGQPLIIQDPDLAFVNEERFRFGVRELEAYAKKNGMLYVQNPHMFALLKQHLGFDAVQYAFNAASILGILDSIRSRLLERLRDARDFSEADRGLSGTNSGGEMA
jgi:hypothetical protein